jgi:WD40 repeat protein
MKKLALALLCLLGTYTSIAQSNRFLERKTFHEGSVLGGSIDLSASTNLDNSKLAVNTQVGDLKLLLLKIKLNFSSTLLNLSTGRIEAKYTGSSLLFFENDLVLQDQTVFHDNWVSIRKVRGGKSYYFNQKDNVRKAISLPEGFEAEHRNGKYIVARDMGTKSLVLENRDGVQTVKHQFDLQYLKISSDGTKVYGRKAGDSTIQIYNIETGSFIKSVGCPNSGNYQMLKNGGFVKSSLTSSSLVNEEGLQLFKFNDAGKFFALNDDETEMITVNNKGSIKLWDLRSGKMIVDVTDTYIGRIRSNKLSGTPFKISGGKFYLIPYSTGIFSVFSSSEGKIIANLFFDELDWAVIAKDGRIDGTPGAFEKLEWREYDGDKLVRTASVESSFDKYYTPRLLYTILNSNEPVPTQTNAISIDEDMKKVPVLEFLDVNDKVVTSVASIATATSKQKNIIVRLKITANSDRIKEVRLYHNGKLVGNEAINGTATYSFTASLNSVFGDANSLYAIASTNDGLDSEKCKLSITYEEKSNTKPKLYALIVGINKYQNPRYELNYALPDATALKSQLEKGGSALFESIVIKTLFDVQATKSNVVNAFKELSNVVKEQDVFIFYYAGHGTMSESAANEFYIVPHDVTQLYGNENILKEKAISASEIKNLSMMMNAQKQIFIIDACHSAGALNSAVTRGAAEERAIGQLARSTGTFWLTAAGSDQFATEFAQLGHGVFTYSLLEALQGKDATTLTDGLLTIRELSSYLEQRVPELSAKYKGNPQYPASFSFGNDFPILIYGSKN